MTILQILTFMKDNEFPFVIKFVKAKSLRNNFSAAIFLKTIIKSHQLYY